MAVLSFGKRELGFGGAGEGVGSWLGFVALPQLAMTSRVPTSTGSPPLLGAHHYQGSTSTRILPQLGTYQNQEPGVAGTFLQNWEPITPGRHHR